MKLSRLTKTFLAGVAIASLTVAASPAFAITPVAATISAGSSLFSINCNAPIGARNQLYSVDPGTGVSMAIGEGTDLNIDNDQGITCAGQPAWDATSSTAYYVGWADGGDALLTMDPATGASVKVADFTGETNGIDSIAIGKTGLAYAIDRYNNFYTLDLETAVLTYVAQITGATEELNGFAVDPTSGLFYVVDVDGYVSELSIDDVALTAIGNFLNDGDTPAPYSLQIDSAGTFWVQNYGNDDDSQLFTMNRSDIENTAVLVAAMTVGGENYISQALLLIPASVPEITSAAPVAQLVAGTAVSFTVTVSKTAGVTYTVTGNLPTGLALNAATGVISGTPTVGGTYTYTITATNGAGSDSATYTQSVVELPNVAG